jgi:hypothetical protein
MYDEEDSLRRRKHILMSFESSLRDTTHINHQKLSYTLIHIKILWTLIHIKILWISFNLICYLHVSVYFMDHTSALMSS